MDKVFSFNDYSVGPLKPDGRSLDTQTYGACIQRPVGLSRSEWYAMASQIADQMNKALERELARREENGDERPGPD